MNVQIVFGRYPPDHSGGGLRIQRTYEAMKDRYGLSYHVLAEPVRTNTGIPDPSNVARLSSAGLAPLLALRVLGFLYKKRKTLDLIHCIGPTRLTVLAAFWGKCLGIPVISEISLDYDHKAKRQNLFYRFLLPYFYKPDAAIALSPRIAKDFESYGLPQSKIYLRPNPVFQEPDKISENNMIESQVKSFSKDYKHLILGRFGERKNQLAGLEILKHLPADHGLILAGPVLEDEGYIDKIKRVIADHNLESQTLIISETVPNPHALYPLITSLWCPSKREGLPNVVLEALWHGRPCFVNKELGLDGYVITPDDGGAFDIDKIQQAANMIEERLKVGFDHDAIQKQARSAFNPDTIIDETYNFLTATRAGN